MRYRRIFASALVGICSAAAVYASPVMPGAEGYYERARAMYSCGNYAGVIDQLHRYLGTSGALKADAGSSRVDAELLLMRAELMRGEFDVLRADCESFLQEYAGSPRVPEALLLLADAAFYDGDYGAALEMYSSLPLENFDNSVSVAARFNYGVSLTRCGHFSEARNVFTGLRMDKDYGGRSRFYLAYLDYVGEDYRNALKGFRALPERVASEMGADFYVAQILFAGGQYDNVLAMSGPLMKAAELLDSPELPSVCEAYRLIGESAFALGNRRLADDNLRSHAKRHEDGGVASAKYMLGLMAYEAGNYAEAEKWFAPITSDDNEIGQSALLYMGQIAARRGDYTDAAISFDKAAHMRYDGRIAETALYNYAAAVASGGRVPFGSASSLLEEFGTQYPNSEYTAAVDEYLAIGYMAEQRYAKALEKLDRIKSPNRQVRDLTLRALYELGVAELSAGRPAAAEAYLRRAASTGGNEALSSQSRLWLGEALYAQKKYSEAINAYKDYLGRVSRSDVNRALGYYDLGYAYYQKGDYKACRAALDNALKISGAGALSSSLRSDAMLRKADCDNYMGNVKEAMAAYEEASVGGPGADYAALQAACMQGIAGNHARKKTDLEAMMAKWPDSPWIQQALYELVRACIAQGDMAGAVSAQGRLARLAPDAGMLREAMLQIAAAYLDKGDTEKATGICKELVSKWPSSSQAVTASEYLQDIYSDKGRISEYLAFIQSVPGAPAPEAAEMDRLTYHSAQAALEKYPSKAAPMEEYIASFPKGRYLPDALLSVAEVYRSSRNSDKALVALDRILTSFADSDAALPALAMKADILQTKGPQYYSEAASLYRDMLRRGGATYAPEAYEGLMTTASTPEEVIVYADKYLSLSDLTADEREYGQEIKADALLMCGQYDKAMELLKALAADTYTSSGGSAAVKMANIYLKTGKPREAEKLMQAFTSGGCEDPDALALGYIALAEAYAAQGNKNKARQYLRALQENYPGGNAEITNQIANAIKQLGK